MNNYKDKQDNITGATVLYGYFFLLLVQCVFIIAYALSRMPLWVALMPVILIAVNVLVAFVVFEVGVINLTITKRKNGEDNNE